jgi:MoaA/NifB/PqqE/SkfB family radical SAM enzyme
MLKTWHWEITKRCNLRCTHCLLCPQDEDMRPENERFRYFEIISKIRQLGGQNILFTGGEPFMVADLLEIAEYAKSLGMSVSVITNGTLFNESSIERCSKLFDVVGVSIDGLEIEHDSIRGDGLFKRTTQFITSLLQTNIQVIVYIVVNGINIDSQKQLLEGLIELGVKSFHYNQINILGNAISNKELHLICLDVYLKRHLLDQISSIVDVDQDIKWDSQCAIDPNVAYLSHHGQIFSCVEIKTQNPLGYIATINDALIKEKWQSYFLATKKPDSCMYEVFDDSGIAIQLNCGKCPLVSKAVK